MKYKLKISSAILVFLSVMVMTTGCKKFIGLDRQTDWNFEPHVLDPHINKTAWEFLKERALGSTSADTLLKKFYDAIIYSGIDTNLYSQPGHTYIFLHNDAITRKSGSSIASDSYWGYYKVGSPAKAATSWSDYPKDQVKNWLLYLIVNGEYSFDNVGPVAVEATSLLPANADPDNPNSLIYFMVANDRDSRFRINDFIGSKRITQARTAGILSTNGPVHVVDRIVEFNQ
jgi:hypothetical protein